MSVFIVDEILHNMMSKTIEEQLVLEGTAYDNFINAVRSKSSQKFSIIL